MYWYGNEQYSIQITIIVLLAMASKTYIGSVLFCTSAYTGAKQASRVPTGSKQDNSPHNDDDKWRFGTT